MRYAVTSERQRGEQSVFRCEQVALGMRVAERVGHVGVMCATADIERSPATTGRGSGPPTQRPRSCTKRSRFGSCVSRSS